MNLREKVYSQLRKVPKGKVTTYKDLAHAAGTKAYRAVGSFMKTNHDPKRTPCYKVVKSDGSLGGYSAPGGVRMKSLLLIRDGVEIKGNRINLKIFKFKFH